MPASARSLAATTPLPDRLAYTVSEACQALATSRATLYEMMADGRIAYVVVGRTRRIPRTELERLVTLGSGS